MKPWTIRPKTGEIWHFGNENECPETCNQRFVAVNNELWLRYFWPFNEVWNVTAVEAWDSMLMHWPKE